MQNSTYCDTCGVRPFKFFSIWTFYEYLMRISSLQPESVWLYSWSQYLQSLPHMCLHIKYADAVNKKSNKSFWKYFLSSPVDQIMSTWQNLTVSSFHCTSTEYNRSEERGFTLKMITSVGKRVHGIGYVKVQEVRFEETGFPSCFSNISHN